MSAMVRSSKRYEIMKNICMSLAFNAIGLCLCISSCNMLGEKNGTENPETGKGRLHIAFSDDYLNSTRAVADIPDTGDFRLTITDSGGNILYEGNYCDSPESLEVDEGSYIVRAVSCEFSMPAFSSPQFGDEQCVLVRAGKVTDVKLECSQMNSGIRLKTDPAFLSSFPAGSLFLKSSSGKLLYSYSESRMAYFSPGSVSLVLSNSGSDETLLTRTLAAGDMLTLKVTVADSGNALSSGRISIAIDTVRNWISESYAIGGENDRGTDVSYAMTVSQAMDCIGSENV